MKTIDEIRQANLLLLIAECGSGRGAAAKLATVTGVKAPMISQYSRAVEGKKGGKPRAMGNDVARQMEVGMGKESGWMDMDHAPARSVKEADQLDLLRRLTPAQLERVIGMVEEFVSMNAAVMGGGGDIASRPLPAAIKPKRPH